MDIGGPMTRREFLKKSFWLLLSIPFVSLIFKELGNKVPTHEAMYYKKLAG